MKVPMVFALALMMSASPVESQQIRMEPVDPGTDIWIDPSGGDTTYFGAGAGALNRAVVWFDVQLLGDGEAYRRRVREFSGRPRRELRAAVVAALQRQSEHSYAAARSAIDSLTRAGVVANCRRHWIVNGFTCDLTGGDPTVLETVPGAKKIFRGFPTGGSAPVPPPPAEVGPLFLEPGPDEPFDLDHYEVPWNLTTLGAERVWRELGVTGRGVLNVISDGGFKLDVAVLTATLYRNPHEVPGNERDDDGNGLVDDYHGFDFDSNVPLNNRPRVARGELIHGNNTAAMVAGRQIRDTNVLMGVAPDSRWAPLTAFTAIERGVEWALEHGGDTYSMSFSMPGLHDFRSHWRKVAEHAALAGLYLVSGAGNFADSTSPAYAPVPVQMRIPEDIPLAVFGVAGVGRDQQRPRFSSQGPVRWDNDHYHDGTVLKPDFTTFNTDVPTFRVDGTATTRPFRGNSFAGPHLTGALALMLSADPDLNVWDAREILAATARDLGEAGPDPQHGYGLVDVYEAVRRVQQHRRRRPAP